MAPPGPAAEESASSKRGARALAELLLALERERPGRAKLPRRPESEQVKERETIGPQIQQAANKVEVLAGSAGEPDGGLHDANSSSEVDKEKSEL